jgi:hypothetical protein
MYALTGQVDGPAISSNPRLRNQNERALVKATGMVVPP